MPSTSGFSGPIIVKSIPFSKIKFLIFSKLSILISTFSAIKISAPMGIPDMVEHIVLISSINNILK